MAETSTRTDDQWTAFENVIQRYERLWRDGRRPQIKTFLSENKIDDLQVLAELIHVDLEFRVKAGEDATAKEYLETFPEIPTDVARELVEAECDLRRRQDERPAANTHRAETPSLSDTSPATFTIDQHRPVLPGFEALQELDHGGMGIVYKAIDRKLNRVVALKTLLGGIFATPNERERFRREAEAIAHLDHPHIVPVYEVGEHDGRSYFTMKYYPGGNLGRRSSEFVSHPMKAAKIVEQIAEAVYHAHLRGILHRDLKPSNVLLDDDGRPHVADFGLAKRFDPGHGPSHASTIAGTPAYMAPEQAGGGGDLTVATDVYGLGAILYELLTGSPPFTGKSPMDVLRKLADHPPVRPTSRNPAVPRDLETIALKCLEKQPQKRYTNARDLVDDLARWRMGKPITARRVPNWERAWRWMRRHPAQAAAMALALMLVLGMVTAAWYAVDQKSQTDRAVELAINETTALRDERKWSEARGAIRRAEELLEQKIIQDGALSNRVAGLRSDVDFADALDKLQLRKSEVSRQRHELHAQRGTEDYQQLFSQHGLSVGESDANEAGQRIRSRPTAVREQIIAALDDWISVAGQDGDSKSCEWLNRVVAVADPDDDWRNRMRKAGNQNDLDTLKQLAAGSDVNRQPPHAVLVLAAMLTSRDAIVEAVDLLRRAQLQMPGEFWINSRLAAYCGALQPPAYDDALRFAQIAQALRPKEPGPQFYVGYILQKLARTDEAIAAFRRAGDLDPDYYVGLFYLGESLIKSGEWTKAETALRHAREMRPDLGSIQNALAASLGKQAGKLDEAIRVQQEAVRLSPKNSYYLNDLAVLLQSADRGVESLAALEKAVALNPKCVPAVANLGYLSLLAGKTEEAIAILKKAIELQPNETAAHLNLGRALKKLGRVDEAIEEYRETIRIRPTFAEAHVSLGVAYEAKDDNPSAFAAYRQAIAVDPNNPNAHCNLGLLLLKTGNPSEALPHLKTGHMIGSQVPKWNRPSAQWIKDAETQLANLKGMP